MIVCNWMPCLYIVPSKALRKQSEKDLPSQILDILFLYVKMGSKFHKNCNIPHTSLRNRQRRQLSRTVPCQGSKTSISSGLFMTGLWTARLICVGQAGFMWCWVTPIAPLVAGRKATFPHNCLPGLPFSALLFSFSSGRSSLVPHES